MSAGRLVLALLVVTGGLGASVLFASKAAQSLRDSPYHDQLLGGSERSRPGSPTTTTKKKATAGKRTRRDAAGTRQRSKGTPPPPRAHSTPPAKTNAKPTAGKDDGSGVFGPVGGSLLLISGLEIAGGVLLVALLLAGLTGRRARMRKRREYALYELHLSAHDEAKPQDLEDMVEQIAGIVRAFATDRARDGQPYVAMELICGDGPSGMEWSVNVRCEPRLVNALDGAINATYPDVRLGREHAEPPQPRAGVLLEPDHVMRFRKKRSWVYALIAPDEALASPPLEQIARAQIALGEPSIVRFQLTPAPSYFEELARKLYKRQENKLVRQERWGFPEGGLQSTLNPERAIAAR